VAEIFQQFGDGFRGDGEHGVSPEHHGFELVHAGGAARFTENRVNRIFTTSRLAKILAQIFRELSGRQSLAIYRELLGPTPRGVRRVGL
jgi:hypothetical protein